MIHHHFLVEVVQLNEAADVLYISHFTQQYFFKLQVLPGAQQHLIPIPNQALRALVEDQPDWTSTELSIAYTRQAKHHLHKEFTWQDRGDT